MRTIRAVRSSVAPWGLSAIRTRANSLGLSPSNRANRCWSHPSSPVPVTPSLTISTQSPGASWRGSLSGLASPPADSPAGVAAGEKMGDGSVQLELPPQQTAPVLPILITLALCALLGFAYGVLRYRKLR